MSNKFQSSMQGEPYKVHIYQASHVLYTNNLVKHFIAFYLRISEDHYIIQEDTVKIFLMLLYFLIYCSSTKGLLKM